MTKVRNVYLTILALLGVLPAMGLGRTDSLGGTYDANTAKSFEKTLYYTMRSRSVIGKLSRAGAAGSASVDEQEAGTGQGLEGTAVIARKKITSGDEVFMTMQQHLMGMPTYGDSAVRVGDFLQWLNCSARVNEIDSPAFQIMGRMSQQRVKESITNIPGATKEEAINYMEEQTEFEFLYALIAGASMSAMNSVANGGLGIKLGVNAAGSAGTPLMPKHVYMPHVGYMTPTSYSTTPATWNAAVNTALGSMEQNANGRVSLTKLKVLRKKLDDIHFRGLRLGGKKYKAVNLCDSDLFYRIDHLMGQLYGSAKPRESGNNPLFDLSHQLEYLDMLFINVPNLAKYRLTAGGSNIPLIGPGLTTDPRSYTNNSTLSPMITLGQRAVLEGFNDSIRISEEAGAFDKGMAVAAKMDLAFVRGEFYAKDGRTSSDAVYNDSSFLSIFHEDGVETLA
jgi:hypothetical protein